MASVLPRPAQQVNPPARGEPYLLTPGPLTTALTTKQAMLVAWGPGTVISAP
jgi:2-aminoethylphosphonate-pyruvate transaminase